MDHQKDQHKPSKENGPPKGPSALYLHKKIPFP